MSVNTLSLLGEDHYNTFQNSSTMLCVYDHETAAIIKVNKSMQDRFNEESLSHMIVIAKEDSSYYGTVNDIPCKIFEISSITSSLCIAEITLAHTRKCREGSEIIAFADVISDGVWEWFPMFDYEYLSNKFWNVLGYDETEITGVYPKSIDMIHPDDRSVRTNCRQEHIQSKGEIPCTYRSRYSRSDGKEIIIQTRAVTIDWLPDGRPWRLLGTHTDITEIVKKDAAEAKGAIISRMSHEIRSPICTILNECEILGIRSGVITNTCRQLLAIANDILSISKVSNAPVKLITEETDLYELVFMGVKRHRLEAKKNGIKIELIIGEIPEVVHADVAKFNQVFDNLMTNAIKYSNGGKKIIVKVDYDELKEMCCTNIQDNGKGMVMELQTRVFEEFVQGDDTVQGAGIGLYLARKLANLMGGDVTIDQSIPGVGTTMSFVSYLPSCRDRTYSKLKNMTVLVVDDMSSNRVILRRRLQCLKDMGMIFTDIVEASNGVEAVEKFTQYGGDIQLVLMDCHMPILDGFDSTLQIHKACDRLGIEPVPVIAVTASVSPDLHDRCRSTGMVGVVTKPYSENDLLFSIVSCIKSKVVQI